MKVVEDIVAVVILLTSFLFISLLVLSVQTDRLMTETQIHEMTEQQQRFDSDMSTILALTQVQTNRSFGDLLALYVAENRLRPMDAEEFIYGSQPVQLKSEFERIFNAAYGEGNYYLEVEDVLSNLTIHFLIDGTDSMEPIRLQLGEILRDLIDQFEEQDRDITPQVNILSQNETICDIYDDDTGREIACQSFIYNQLFHANYTHFRPYFVPSELLTPEEYFTNKTRLPPNEYNISSTRIEFLQPRQHVFFRTNFTHTITFTHDDGLQTRITQGSNNITARLSGHAYFEAPVTIDSNNMQVFLTQNAIIIQSRNNETVRIPFAKENVSISNITFGETSQVPSKFYEIGGFQTQTLYNTHPIEESNRDIALAMAHLIERNSTQAMAFIPISDDIPTTSLPKSVFDQYPQYEFNSSPAARASYSRFQFQTYCSDDCPDDRAKRSILQLNATMNHYVGIYRSFPVFFQRTSQEHCDFAPGGWTPNPRILHEYWKDYALTPIDGDNLFNIIDVQYNEQNEQFCALVSTEDKQLCPGCRTHVSSESMINNTKICPHFDCMQQGDRLFKLLAGLSGSESFTITGSISGNGDELVYSINLAIESILDDPIFEIGQRRDDVETFSFSREFISRSANVNTTRIILHVYDRPVFGISGLTRVIPEHSVDVSPEKALVDENVTFSWFANTSDQVRLEFFNESNEKIYELDNQLNVSQHNMTFSSPGAYFARLYVRTGFSVHEDSVVSSSVHVFETDIPQIINFSRTPSGNITGELTVHANVSYMHEIDTVLARIGNTSDSNLQNFTLQSSSHPLAFHSSYTGSGWLLPAIPDGDYFVELVVNDTQGNQNRSDKLEFTFERAFTIGDVEIGGSIDEPVSRDLPVSFKVHSLYETVAQANATIFNESNEIVEKIDLSTGESLTFHADFEQMSEDDFEEISRILSIHKLPQGNYTLEVVVVGSHGSKANFSRQFRIQRSLETTNINIPEEVSTTIDIGLEFDDDTVSEVKISVKDSEGNLLRELDDFPDLNSISIPLGRDTPHGDYEITITITNDAGETHQETKTITVPKTQVRILFVPLVDTSQSSRLTENYFNQNYEATIAEFFAVTQLSACPEQIAKDVVPFEDHLMYSSRRSCEDLVTRIWSHLNEIGYDHAKTSYDAILFLTRTDDYVCQITNEFNQVTGYALGFMVSDSPLVVSPINQVDTVSHELGHLLGGFFEEYCSMGQGHTTTAFACNNHPASYNPRSQVMSERLRNNYPANLLDADEYYCNPGYFHDQASLIQRLPDGDPRPGSIDLLNNPKQCCFEQCTGWRTHVCCIGNVVEQDGNVHLSIMSAGGAHKYVQGAVKKRVFTPQQKNILQEIEYLQCIE
ncbi:MAG: hypothetical protein ACMXYF_04080 [Candidatus Woesearchaeota archaeon]